VQVNSAIGTDSTHAQLTPIRWAQPASARCTSRDGRTASSSRPGLHRGPRQLEPGQACSDASDCYGTPGPDMILGELLT